MYHHYFDDDQNVRSEFSKQFISLWPGWLGMENYHKLDEVTPEEWSRFNHFLELVGKEFAFELASLEKEKLLPLAKVSSVLSSYEESQQKESSQFIRLVIPELECVISEEWDYTYILWHKDLNAVVALAPYIAAAKLCVFT
jgi:hypothetical protein